MVAPSSLKVSSSRPLTACWWCFWGFCGFWGFFCFGGFEGFGGFVGFGGFEGFGVLVDLGVVMKNVEVLVVWKLE